MTVSVAAFTRDGPVLALDDLPFALAEAGMTEARLHA
jgi:hypothetical protein